MGEVAELELGLQGTEVGNGGVVPVLPDKLPEGRQRDGPLEVEVDLGLGKRSNQSKENQTRSTMIAIPCPPPMQAAATP